MEETSFKDGSVQEAFKRFVVARLNIDHAKALTHEFKVKSVPWLVVVDPFRRDKLAEHIGAADAPTLRALLDGALARWSAPEQGPQGNPIDISLQYRRGGLSLQTADGNLVVDFWTHHMAQAIAFPDDFEGEEFRIRHSRFGLQAVVASQVTLFGNVDFAQDRPLLDAYAEYQFTRPINVRLGRFKVPMGTQFLPRRDFWDFVEPTPYIFALLPRRDIGAMLYGGGGMSGINMKYWVGVFNGVQDGYSDPDDDQETAARVTLNPFPSPEFDLNVSAAWTGGSSAQPLGGFRVTDESITDVLLFPAPGGAACSGNRHRFSVEAEVLWRNFAAGAERVVQSSRIAAPLVPEDRHEMEGVAAWAAWVATGERKSRDEWLIPERPWGALEFVARYSGFEADETLAALASPFTDGASHVAFGVNWYPNRFSRIMLDVQLARFDDPVPVAAGSTVTDDRHQTILGAFEIRF
jgi:phosphate-selective porin OprO/OprP